MEEVRLSTLNQLDQLEEIFLDGNRIPFSGNRLVNEQDAIDLLDDIRESIPKEINIASELIKQGDQYISRSKRLADEILKKAKSERNKLISAVGVRQEAERQITEMQSYSRHKCEKILQEARLQASAIESDMQSRMSQMETSYVLKNQKLEDESLKRRKYLENEDIELRKDLKKRFDNNNNKAIEELERQRQEGQRIHIQYQNEAERIKNEAISIKKQTQQKCDSLLTKARNEAAFIQDGANKYAEQTLVELEKRLIELNQVVLAGKKELGKIPSIRKNRKESSNNQSSTVPFSRIRTDASKFKDSISHIG